MLVVGRLSAWVIQVTGPHESYPPTGPSGLSLMAVLTIEAQKEKASPNIQVLHKSLLMSHLLLSHWPKKSHDQTWIHSTSWCKVTFRVGKKSEVIFADLIFLSLVVLIYTPCLVHSRYLVNGIYWVSSCLLSEWIINKWMRETGLLMGKLRL